MPDATRSQHATPRNAVRTYWFVRHGRGRKNGRFLRLLLRKTHRSNSFCTQSGFDHGAGHPLLFLDDAKAPNYRKNNGFKDLGNYSEWPKVAGAVIKANNCIE